MDADIGDAEAAQHYSAFGCHSRARRCASEISAGVIRPAVMSRLSLAVSCPCAAARFDGTRARSSSISVWALVGQTMHKVDEHIAVADIEGLTRVYLAVLEDYFGVAQ